MTLETISLVLGNRRQVRRAGDHHLKVSRAPSSLYARRNSDLKAACNETLGITATPVNVPLVARYEDTSYSEVLTAAALAFISDSNLPLEQAHAWIGNSTEKYRAHCSGQLVRDSGNHHRCPAGTRYPVKVEQTLPDRTNIRTT